MDDPKRPQRILLVDDEEAITALLAPFLERAGFAVAVATDGEAALRRVDDFNPDLIILDVLMPRLDGRETLRYPQCGQRTRTTVTPKEER